MRKMITINIVYEFKIIISTVRDFLGSLLLLPTKILIIPLYPNLQILTVSLNPTQTATIVLQYPHHQNPLNSTPPNQKN
jgi:hypothetical protein